TANSPFTAKAVGELPRNDAECGDAWGGKTNRCRPRLLSETRSLSILVNLAQDIYWIPQSDICSQLLRNWANIDGE
ncbi:MAG: hypothetical protein ORN98_09400, partial [Alphaproteobacteria bacterium]|nr:hypothetical protein [Alphaproteobacteria bacterium]